MYRHHCKNQQTKNIFITGDHTGRYHTLQVTRKKNKATFRNKTDFFYIYAKSQTKNLALQPTTHVSSGKSIQ